MSEQRDTFRDLLIARIEQADSDAALDQADEVRTGLPAAEASVLRAVLKEYDLTSSQRQRLLQWLDDFEAETRAVPIGEEDEAKGSSVYSWRMSFVREARGAIKSEAER